MKNVEFQNLTGINPEHYKAINMLQLVPGFAPNNRKLSGWNATGLVKRVEVSENDDWADEKLITHRPGRSGSYEWTIMDNMLMCLFSRPGSETTLTYFFEHTGQPEEEVIDLKMFVEFNDGVFKISDLTTIDDQPAEEVDPTYFSTVLVGGGKDYDLDLDAPVLTPPAAVMPGKSFTWDWRQDADKYIGLNGKPDAAQEVTLRCRVRNNWMYKTILLGSDGAVLEEVDAQTPHSHFMNKRDFIRISDFKKP